MSQDRGRSELMARINSKDTRPELRLRKALWARGRRYRLHAKTPAGRPDVVFPGPRLAVFVDGCFWHGCPDHYVRPRSRADFWADKLRTNVERDRRQTLELEAAGWQVCRIWEHEIETDLKGTVARVEGMLEGPTSSPSTARWRVIRVDPLDDAGNTERRILQRLRDPEVERIVVGERSTRKW